LDGSHQESVTESGLQPGRASGSPSGDVPPRSLRRLIGETFGIYRRNFWPLVIIATIPQPVNFLAFVIPVVDDLLKLVGGFLGAIAFGATIYVVAQQYVTQRVDFLGGYRRAFSKGIYLIVSLILLSLLLFPLCIFFMGAFLVFFGFLISYLGVYVGIAFLIFGIPMLIFGALISPIALYFAVIWFFTPHAIMVENKGLGSAFGRSRALVRGYWWGTFGMGIVLSLTTLFIALIPGIVIAKMGSIPAIGSFVAIGLGWVLYSLIFPITPIGATLVYFDLRVRHEGYTFQQMATEVGAG